MTDRLSPETRERLAALGLSDPLFNRHGEDRVRWVLDALGAERDGVPDPPRWVLNQLHEHFGEPEPIVQLGLPFGAAAAEALRPPDGTRWGRHKPTGGCKEVAWVDADSIKWADGTRFPAHLWSDDWEWFSTPDAPAP